MTYTEMQMIEAIRRLSKFYVESYPHDDEAMKRFIRWCYSQYGYIYQEHEN